MSGGSVYNYFRDYSPDIGRYVQSDPAGILDSTNTYAYVDADPLRSKDFFGLGRSGGASNAEKYSGKYCGSTYSFTLLPDDYRGIISFTSACKAHDQCYATCGSSRMLCDLQLSKDLTAACTGGTYGTKFIAACLEKARAGLSLVQQFGSGPFNAAQKEGCASCQRP